MKTLSKLPGAHQISINGGITSSKRIQTPEYIGPLDL